MIRVSISEAKNRLSALLDKVRHGETVLIMDRSKPIARLDPVRPERDSDLESWLAELERGGLIRRPRVALSKFRLREPIAKARRGKSVVDALLAEREEGR